ncbi:hypothetical protein ANN_16507 [Periplaneta americana]|uniref:Uncharacterized protein n=1 Tax=Periplaneta americana TaxID=6978 RepID=A0ABQ8SRV1_PERAM|nr:hypothetical protein ANN_16507 [Periplaneta americana]
MLGRNWAEVEYRFDILRVTNVALIIVFPTVVHVAAFASRRSPYIRLTGCTKTDFYLPVVVITEDVQNVHLLLEYRPHIDVSLTCEHDPKLQEYCVCPQNIPQSDSEGIPNQAPETNKPMILNGPTSRNREGSDQVSVEAKQLGHLYLSIDQGTFEPSTECNRLGMNCQSARLILL